MSTASDICADDIQHWVGKAQSHSNGKWLKRVLGAARKRDRPKMRAAVFFRFGTGWPQFYGRSKQVIEESK